MFEFNNGNAREILKERLGEKTVLIILIDLTDDEGDNGYAYFALLLKTYKDFQEACKAGEVDLEKYGVILAEGKGKPTDEVKAKMIRLYGADDN